MSDFFNPNLATLKFKCTFHTKLGQQLRLVGNIEELGCWDPSKSMYMLTNKDNYPIWESAPEITAPVGMEINYKYVLYSETTSSFLWETLPDNINRKHTISSSGNFVIFDEENTTRSCVQGQYMEMNRESDSEEKGEDLAFIDSNNSFESLIYDANNFSANNIHDTFMFCINQKILTEDRIIIASAHLPIEVDKLPDDTLSIRVTDESLIYSILYGMKEKDICEVVWVGMLKNHSQYSESELDKINEFLKDNNIYMIMANETVYKNYWIFMNNIMAPVFVDSTIDMHK
jgi:hypothetical protein